MEDIQHTFTVCLLTLFMILFNAEMIYFYVVKSIFSFIAFGLGSNLKRLSPLSDFFKKSVACFLLVESYDQYLNFRSI